MPITLFSTPFGSLDIALLAGSPEARDWLSELQGPDSPKWIWVVPSQRRKRAIVRKWPGPENGRAALLPRIVTFDGLADQVATTQGIVGKKISSMERRLRVLAAWQQTLPNLASGFGTATQMDQAIKVWQDNEVIPVDAVNKRFYEQYHQNLKASNAVDRHGWLGVLASRLTAKPMDLIALVATKVVIDGFHLLSLPEIALLRELGKHIDLRLWVPCHHDGHAGELLQYLCDHLQTPWQATKPLPPMPVTKSRLDCQDMQAEVREVTRRIHQRLKQPDAPKPHEIAIVLPGPEYDPLIRQAFADAGITINLAGRSRTLLSSGPGRLIQAAINLIQNAPSIRGLMNFLRQPIILRKSLGMYIHRLGAMELEMARFAPPDDFGGWDDLLLKMGESLSEREIGIKEGELVEEEEKTRYLERKEDLLVMLGKVRQILGTIRAMAQVDISLAEAVNHLITYLSELLLGNWISPGHNTKLSLPGVVWQADQLAWQRIVSVFRELVRLPQNILPLGRQGKSDPMGLLLMVLAGESYQIKTEDDEGVQVMEIRETRGIPFEEIHVLGLKSGSYGSATEEEILRELLKEERTAQGLSLLESALLFEQLRQSGAKNLLLYRPSKKLDEPLMPSPWIETYSISKVYLGREVWLGLPGVQVATGMSQPLDLLEPFVAAEADQTAKGFLEMLHEVKRKGQIWSKQVESPQLKPWVHEYNPFFANRDKPFSPSSLEQYTRCPFRFFVKHVLGFFESDSDETALRQGSLVHKLFEEFMVWHRGIATDLVDLPSNEVATRAKLLDLWDQLLTHDPHARFMDARCRARVIAEGGIIDLYVQNLGRYKDAGYKHVASEIQVGPEQFGLDDPVYLSGRIDDHFQIPGGPSLLTDYKSGRPPGQGEFVSDHDVKKTMLQMDYYAACLKKKGFHVTKAIYLFLWLNQNNEDGRDLKNSTRMQGDYDKDWAGKPQKGPPASIDTNLAEKHLIECAGSIRKGLFPLTTFNGKGDTECTSSCLGRNICRTPVNIKVNNY